MRMGWTHCTVGGSLAGSVEKGELPEADVKIDRVLKPLSISTCVPAAHVTVLCRNISG
jgi:hypothetical protein